MAGMAKTSYLRVYQGIGRFSVEEQGRWLGQIDGEPHRISRRSRTVSSRMKSPIACS
jgi:hypothetical protein